MKTRKKFQYFSTFILLGVLILSACASAPLTSVVNAPGIGSNAPTEAATRVPLPNTGATSASLPATPSTSTLLVAQPSGGSNLEANQNTPLVVTPQDNGRTIQLQVGERFSLKLGETGNWSVNIANQAIVSRVIGILTVRGVQGIYEARQVGETTLTASNDSSSTTFSITILVTSQENVSQQASTPVNFNTIHMVTAMEGWALGAPAPANGGGQSAYPQTSSIYRTSDGGQTWQDVTPQQVSLNPTTQVFFLDSQNAWLANPSGLNGNTPTVTVYHTENGGESWVPSQTIRTQGSFPVMLSFANDAQRGWMTLTAGPGAGSEPLAIYQTNDSGITWQLVSASPNNSESATPNSLPASCIKSGIRFRDDQEGWATGSCPGSQVFLYHTTNGGKTWTHVALPIPQGYPENLFTNCQCNLMPVEFVTPQDGFLPVTIFEAQTASYLYVTHNGGETWTPYSLPVSQLPAAPDFTDAQNGFLTDGQQLYSTQDGGHTWRLVGNLPVENIMNGLNFVDAQDGFITNGELLYITHDSGATWTSMQPLANPAPGAISTPPTPVPTTSPVLSIPLPGQATTISFSRGSIAEAITTNLTSGQPKAFRIHVLPTQAMLVSADSPVNVQVYDPNGHPVTGVSALPGPLIVRINQNGSYRLVFAGQGKVTFSVYVSPIGRTFASPLEASPQRIRFAAGAYSYKFTVAMQADRPLGYLLRASAGQTMQVDTQGEVTAVLLSPGERVLTAQSSRPGTWQFYLPENGDYTLVLFGLNTSVVNVGIQ